MELPAYHPFRSAEAKEEYLSLYEMRSKMWPIVSESRTIETSYGQTFMRISGPTDAPALVLLHGTGCNSLMWVPNIEALSASYKTYALDSIYDYGRSVYTRPFKDSSDFVNWLDELFTSLELGSGINLMGMSYGGWLTSQYALRHPDRLAKIVLLAPAGTVLPLSAGFMLRVFLCLLPFRRFSQNLMYWLLEDMAHKDDASRKLVEDSADDMLTAARCFKPRRGVIPTVLEDAELQGIKVPALFLVGENEKIYPAQKAIQRLNQVAPQIKTGIIPNAGHDLPIVQAEMVTRKVLEFLKQP
jgi:pimeloyl-ACP methyl ester carboxylesterase